MASIRPDGSGLTMLGEGHDPTISPDGAKVVYTGDVPGGVSVFVMDLDGGNKTRIVREASAVGATFPNWSPDGKEVVYSFPVGDALELFVIGADGSNNRQLTHLRKVCTPAAWSPDGAWISFRMTDERYWSDPVKMKKTYSEKPADKRPVWVIRPDGSDAQSDRVPPLPVRHRRQPGVVEALNRDQRHEDAAMKRIRTSGDRGDGSSFSYWASASWPTSPPPCDTPRRGSATRSEGARTGSRTSPRGCACCPTGRASSAASGTRRGVKSASTRTAGLSG